MTRIVLWQGANPATNEVVAFTSRVDPLVYPAFDLDGRPRVQGGKIDHGCYEANPPGTLLLVR